MANWHRLQFYTDDEGLNLYFEDYLSGEFDTTLVYREGKWYRQEYNDSANEDEWFSYVEVELEPVLISLLENLNNRDR